MHKQKNPLEDYFRKNKQRRMDKYMHYFDIYHRHFSEFRGKKVTVLEFGVKHGGSLQMWKHYFGNKSRIIGVDIDPRCKNVVEKQIEVYIGDQGDRNFLKKLAEKIGPVDIAIDDGGHHMQQQITTFEEIFPIVRNGGLFLVEDLQTSYWNNYDGGYKKKGTFIEYAKDRIDDLHGWCSRDEQELKVNEFTRSIKAMHIYDSVIVFGKDKIEPPHSEAIGFDSLNNTLKNPKHFTTSSSKYDSMKNLLIYLEPNKTYDKEIMANIKMQVDNSLKYWRPKDILLITNLPFKYSGIKTILSDKHNKIEVIFSLLQEGRVKEGELWWYHDNDIFQMRKFKSWETILIGVDTGFVLSRTHSPIQNIFFSKDSSKIFEWIINRSHRLRSDPETAFKSLADENYRGFNSRYKKLIPLKTFHHL